MTNHPSPELLATVIGKLNKSRLADECAARLGDGALPEGVSRWSKARKDQLIDILVRDLPSDEVIEIATDAEAYVRPPGFQGYIWRFRDAVTPEEVAGFPSNFPSGNVGGLEDVELRGLDAPLAVAAAFFEVAYAIRGETLTATGQVAPFEQHRTARIAIDPEDRVVTVFAYTPEIAGIVASATGSALGQRLQPLRLTEIEVPSVNGALFSPTALQIFELVYGRFSLAGVVLHAPGLTTRPSIPDAVAQYRKSGGDSGNMLDDPDVQRELSRGDELRSIRFFIRERSPAQRQSPMVVPVTIAVDASLGISLSVGRGPYSSDRVMAFYEVLRKLMMRRDPSNGATLQDILDSLQGNNDKAD